MNLSQLEMNRRFEGQIGDTDSEINLVAVFHDSEYANKGFGINDS
ncbi:hypothetical protein [Paraglaciecola sp.]|nr:hypothetical protein [Paraglaciecola sp.]MDP5031531.1 hypothetical protein [Paraglaciecola sp.]